MQQDLDAAASRSTRGVPTSTVQQSRQIDIMSDPSKAPTADLPRIEGAVEAGGFLAGPPDLVVEQLKKLEERYPALDRVSVSHPVGTPWALIQEQRQRFGEEVMPAFKGKVEATVPSD